MSELNLKGHVDIYWIEKGRKTFQAKEISCANFQRQAKWTLTSRDCKFDVGGRQSIVTPGN